MALLAFLLLAGCQGSRDTLVAVYEGNAVMHVENGSNPPSYFILAPLPQGKSPEDIATRVMSLACPSGSPRLLSAQGMSLGDNVARGAYIDAKLLEAGFTCNYAITSLRVEDSFVQRVPDRNGLPTYEISGQIARDDLSERKAARIMHATCLPGDPELLQADYAGAEVISSSVKFWSGLFTCNQPIRSLGAPQPG
jgi:hypothetical protein